MVLRSPSAMLVRLAVATATAEQSRKLFLQLLQQLPSNRVSDCQSHRPDSQISILQRLTGSGFFVRRMGSVAYRLLRRVGCGDSDDGAQFASHASVVFPFERTFNQRQRACALYCMEQTIRAWR